MIRTFKNIGIFIFCTFVLSGCAVVKPYQRAMLNDEEMDLGLRHVEYFETSFQSYREGASGGEGGKMGGGCGCN